MSGRSVRYRSDNAELSGAEFMENARIRALEALTDVEYTGSRYLGIPSVFAVLLSCSAVVVCLFLISGLVRSHMSGVDVLGLPVRCVLLAFSLLLDFCALLLSVGARR